MLRLDRAIEAARAPELLSVYRCIEGAINGDRSMLHELVRATEGGFAANLLKLMDRAHQVANEA